MIEVKPDLEIPNDDVQAKQKAADTYCKVVSENIGSFGIVKPWRYIIVPTSKIKITATIMGILGFTNDVGRFIH